jgi:hypothetical protein
MEDEELQSQPTDEVAEDGVLGAEQHTSFIYVMWSGTITIPRSKIGYSDNPAARCATLSQGAPFPIVLHWQWEVLKHEARRLEQECHKLLASRRVRGEWFRIPSYTARDAVQEVLRDNGVLPRLTETNLRTGEVKDLRLKSRFPLP